MSKFGGGGYKCTICDKTSYAAETIMYEKKPYHIECFRCSECNTKITASNAGLYEDKLYCKKCFAAGGFAQKQRNVKWTPSGNTGEAKPGLSKFGGGGVKCTVCEKTVYAAEQVNFEKKPYHAECLKCTECDLKTTPSNANLFDDKVICSKCFKDKGYAQKQTKTTKKTGTSNALASKFGGGGVKCTVCEKTVYAAEQVSFEKKPYHADCLKCKECDLKTTPSNANLFDDNVICSKCFREKGYAQKQTKVTKKTGTSNALASKFGGGGTKCYVCDKTVYSAEMVSYEKKAFHSECFKCLNCDKKISPSGAEAKKEGDDVKVYCKKCWGELGLNRAKLN